MKKIRGKIKLTQKEKQEALEKYKTLIGIVKYKGTSSEVIKKFNS